MVLLSLNARIRVFFVKHMKWRFNCQRDMKAMQGNRRISHTLRLSS
jgi:hypothetical protein